eukprot:scaffold65940_cov68-Phaeocystis_antarctica.AAC.7
MNCACSPRLTLPSISIDCRFAYPRANSTSVSPYRLAFCAWRSRTPDQLQKLLYHDEGCRTRVTRTTLHAQRSRACLAAEPGPR